MTTPKRTESAPRQAVFGVVLRKALPPTAVVGLVAAVVLGVVNGLSGGVSALVGVVIALLFFASGLVVMARFVVDTQNPLLFMSVGMATYFAQVIVLFGVIVLAGRIAAFDTLSAGIAILVCVVVWQVAQMRAWRHARVPVYDDGDDAGVGAARRETTPEQAS